MTHGDEWAKHMTRVAAQEIRHHREARGLSAQKLADACGALGYPIPRSVLANLESGRRPALSLAELFVLAAALDVPPIALMLPLTPPGPDDSITPAATVEVLPGKRTPLAEALLWIIGERPLQSSRNWTDAAAPAGDLSRHYWAVQGWLETREGLDDARTRGNVREVEYLSAELERLAARIRRERNTILSRGLRPPALPVDVAHVDEADNADV